MEPAVAEYQLKIKRLLEKLLKSKCQNKVAVYLNKLLTRLEPKEQTEVESTLITLPVFMEWITQAVATWNFTKETPSTSVAVFTLELASLLSSNEERFTNLNNNNFFIKLVNISKARQPDQESSIQLGYIKLLSAFLEHKSGIEWMTACNFWEDVLSLSIKSKNVEVANESIRFICRILENAIDHDKEFCVGVIKKIVLPLRDDIDRAIQFSGNTETLEYLGPTLRVVGKIFKYFLEGVLLSRNDFRVLLLIWSNFQLEDKVTTFMAVAKNEKFAFYLGEHVFIMQFLDLYVGVVEKKLNNTDVTKSVNKIMNLFIAHLYKIDFIYYLKFCDFGQLYWRVMGTTITHSQPTESEKMFKFVEELTLLMLLPNFCLMLRYCYNASEFENLLADAVRDKFLDKIWKILTHNGVRLAYVWRDFFVAQEHLFTTATEVLRAFMRKRKYWLREQGVFTFQMLIYVVKDFISSAKEFPEKLEIFTEGLDYFILVFEVLATVIEEFKITWKDGCEAVDVLVVSFEVLTLPIWPVEGVVKILNLLEISIAKYMSPNLALLVDRTSDSTIDLLGPLLYSKLHDLGEVKKAALEIVNTLSYMSNNKFPSLQKVLMDSELPTLVVKMSTCDGESFVRATAIKCLQEMIQVEEIWNNALKSENLTQKMREILLNETEGIVRVEAATFMCIAYEQQQFPKETLDSIYETMIHSSTTDLHWEVKVRALGFWEKVIKNHLQNQGMIDGAFPNVTFSKEHRKIVTLTDSEIRKRLQKVLSQLSTIGCLGVLMSAIKDDCDMEVSKTAVKITQRLVELFKTYNVYGDGSVPTSPLPTENGGTSVPSVSSGISMDDVMDSPASYQPDFNDEIIDQIVNSKDVCLLKNVYSPSDYGSVTNYDIQVRKIVTPNEFLQYTQQDLNTIIAEKKNWLNGIEDLGSLLDDMLKSYDDDVNNMDCY